MGFRLRFHEFYAILLSALLFTAADVASADAKRVAVVVGISDYKSREVKRLPNAEGDAEKVADALTQTHRFDQVHRLLSRNGNTTRSDLLAAWRGIVEKLRENDVVVFYYAGHALELKGRNYLMTSDVEHKPDLETVGSITETSVDFPQLLEILGERQHEFPNVVGIFIIDACRENPFVFDWDRRDNQAVGLGPTALPPQELFVLYSAGINQWAWDGPEDGSGSPFIRALLEQLAVPDISVGEMAQKIRLRVFEGEFNRRHKQLPAYYDQLRFRRTISGVREPRTYVANASTNPVVKLTWQYAPHDILLECEFCPEMVVLPPGTFTRGTRETQEEQPSEQVTISKSFAIGRYEVTVREWAACVAEGACRGGSAQNSRFEDMRPASSVSWNDARQYTAWLSKKTGAKYRLASEAEWEYAAGAGRGHAFPFGAVQNGDYRPICSYANGADQDVGVVAGSYRFCTDGVGREVARVGRYRPNSWGLHDMAGNVHEWVNDCWHPNYRGSPTDGSAWDADTTECRLRVARGGSWRSGIKAMRSSARNAFPPDHARATIGLRVVREIN